MRIVVLSLIIGLHAIAPLSTAYGIESTPKSQGSALVCYFKELKLRFLGKPTSPAPQGDIATESRDKLRRFLNREPEIRIEDRLFSGDPHNQGKQERMAQFYESNKDLGQLNYALNGDELYIDITIVTQHYRELGIGGTLLESVLKKHPEIHRVRATYVDANAKAVFEALSQGMQLDSAIMNAPTSKTLRRLGFSKVVPGSVRRNGTTFDVELERP